MATKDQTGHSPIGVFIRTPSFIERAPSSASDASQANEAALETAPAFLGAGCWGGGEKVTGVRIEGLALRTIAERVRSPFGRLLWGPLWAVGTGATRGKAVSPPALPPFDRPP